jgi:hypothetical protein
MEFGFLFQVNQYESSAWICPMFATPKADKFLRSLAD